MKIRIQQILLVGLLLIWCGIVIKYRIGWVSLVTPIFGAICGYLLATINKKS